MARYTVLIDGRSGAYGVVVPDLPGCVAMGATIEEAVDHVADAMRDWAEATEGQGGTVPAPRPIEVLRREADVAAGLAAGASLASVPLVRETGRPVKANLSLDAGILDALDAEASRLKLTRSALVEVMAKRMLARG